MAVPALRRIDGPWPHQTTPRDLRRARKARFNELRKRRFALTTSTSPGSKFRGSRIPDCQKIECRSQLRQGWKWTGNE